MTRSVRAIGWLAAGVLLTVSAYAEESTNPRAPIERRYAVAGAANGVRSPLAVDGTAFSTEIPLIAHINPNAATDTLVLSAAHPFTITLTARDPRTNNTGTGVAIPENDIFGFFSIPTLTGNASNPEVFIKIIDGRALNNAFWVFYNGLTDLEYTLTVREASTGRVKTYHKSAGNTECGAQDTSAFPVTGGAAAPEEKTPLDVDSILPPNRATTLRTSIEFTNTTNKNGVTVEWQYAYTCVAAACNPVGHFTRTARPSAGTCLPGQCLSLQGFDSRHFDDFVSYLASFPGVLDPGADQGSYGTLLVTFRNLNTNQTNEGLVYARTYSRNVEVDPLKGTIGFATPGSLFVEAAKTTLVGTARDTRGGGGATVGTLSSNVGIRNSDVNGTLSSDTVNLSFYDTASGQRVGGILTLAGLRPGELREVNDIWTAAGIPSSVHTVIVFADVQGSTSSSATIEGWITIDDVNSKSSSFYEMKCADVACGT